MLDVLTDLLTVLDSTMRLSTPLLLACLAGLLSERAGIFDIGLEGKMLAAAFFSAALRSSISFFFARMVALSAAIAASLRAIFALSSSACFLSLSDSDEGACD